MNLIARFLRIFVLLVLALSGTNIHASIKKCQDEKGRWHYGDHAAKECAKARSDVIEFNAGKAGEKVIDAPPTQGELRARREEQLRKQEEEKREAEQAAEDKLLAQSYAHEDDIIYERNRKLKDLQQSIDSGTATLEHLKGVLARAEKTAAEEKKSGKGVSKNTEETLKRAQNQVERHTALIEDKRKEMEETTAHYDDALKRYREMKARRASSVQ
jgi:chromosome segregation ATPase